MLASKYFRNGCYLSNRLRVESGKRARLLGATKSAVVLSILFLLCSVTYSQDWNERYGIGVTLLQPGEKAPIFIGSVWRESPAMNAGIIAGERLLAVNGGDVMSAREAAGMLSAKEPGGVSLRLWQTGRIYEVAVQREKFSSLFAKQGKRILSDGMIVPLDATEAEVERMRQCSPDRIVERAFPHHYPLDPQLFAAGFEVLFLRNPVEVVVGGIEDGPGSRAGLRRGDMILSINGNDPRHMSVIEVEQMLSSSQPESMELKIDRAGAIKTVEFKLEKTSEILKQNQLQMVNGTLIPAGLAEEDLRWFLPEKD